jgi:hypothetical protein
LAKKLVRNTVAIFVVFAVNDRSVSIIGTKLALILILRYLITVFHHFIDRSLKLLARRKQASSIIFESPFQLIPRVSFLPYDSGERFS